MLDIKSPGSFSKIKILLSEFVGLGNWGRAKAISAPPSHKCEKQQEQLPEGIQGERNL